MLSGKGIKLKMSRRGKKEKDTSDNKMTLDYFIFEKLVLADDKGPFIAESWDSEAKWGVSEYQKGQEIDHCWNHTDNV